jgi:hypothetical protein
LTLRRGRPPTKGRLRRSLHCYGARTAPSAVRAPSAPRAQVRWSALGRSERVMHGTDILRISETRSDHKRPRGAASGSARVATLALAGRSVGAACCCDLRVWSSTVSLHSLYAVAWGGQSCLLQRNRKVEYRLQRSGNPDARSPLSPSPFSFARSAFAASTLRPSILRRFARSTLSIGYSARTDQINDKNEPLTSRIPISQRTRPELVESRE